MPHATDTTGLWGASALNQPDTFRLEGGARCDVVIIGGGFTGLSAALALAERGASIVLCEAQSTGYGGSGRNVGLVNAGMWMPYDDIKKSLGQRAGSKLIHTLETAPASVFRMIEKHNIECESTQNGTLNCAHSKKSLDGLTQRMAYRQSLGSNVRMLDADETSKRTGTKIYSGAMFDFNAGTIQPLGYAYGLTRAAQNAGASIYTDTPINSLKQIGNDFQLSTPHGNVTAKKVLIAVGAYGKHHKNSSPPVSGGDNTALNFFQCATNPLSEAQAATILPGGEGVWDTDPVMTSFRMDQARRLIIGSVGRLDIMGGMNTYWATRRIRKLFPHLPQQISSNNWSHQWFGRIGMTSDNLPKITQPMDGVISIYGFNGRGIGPGTIFGTEIADYFTNGNEEILSLPISEQHNEKFTVLRGIAIETAVRIYHTLQVAI